MKLRRTRHEGWYEIMSACPICGHKGWCGINKELTIVHCMRVPSDQFRDTAIGRQYIHYLDPDRVPKSKVEIEIVKLAEKKPDYHLNRVYRALMTELGLSGFHLDHLQNDRKMSAEAIRLREYRTMPDRDRYRVAKRVISRLNHQDDLLGVPGFFVAEGTYGPYWTMAGESGLMIPFRSIRNEILGWQIRVDHVPLELSLKGHIKGEILEEVTPDDSGRRRAKCSLKIQNKSLEVILTEKEKKECFSKSGEFVFSVELKQAQRYWWWSSSSKPNGSSIGSPLPYHLALPYPCLKYWEVGEDPSGLIDCEEVWITEGPIKADIAADKMVKPFIAIPGAGAFQLALEPLIALGCRHVVLAYDADVVTTPEVQRSLEMCAQFFADETDMSLSLAMWDISQGKGIDDLLANELIPQVSKILD